MEETPRVAVLFQDIDPPVIDGTKKPKKPGGYRDSGADIAYNLSTTSKTQSVCPVHDPNPAQQEGWSFPDTEQGILNALELGATHLWANTVLFTEHPLQLSSAIGAFADHVRVVGQPPLVVQQYDDKNYTNNYLRHAGKFTMPKTWSLTHQPTLEFLQGLPYPLVAKPTRGRGSYGVKLCHDAEQLSNHLENLRSEGLAPMIEEYLSGEEATITVMPPCEEKLEYWALPVVARYNHQDGIAPYNGVVAVTKNSKAVPDCERDSIYAKAMRECEGVAKLLCATAPIRIDIRRRNDSSTSEFVLFDINMKPNMTGPGRPGREDQASLTLIAASALGWDYKELLLRILKSAPTLKILRGLEPRS